LEDFAIGIQDFVKNKLHQPLKSAIISFSSRY
jgi:hypothetical protein